MFVRLIHDGQLRLAHVEDHTEDELRGILDDCGESIHSAATKVGAREKACGCVFIMTRSNQADSKIRQEHKCPCFLRKCRHHVIKSSSS